MKTALLSALWLLFSMLNCSVCFAKTTLASPAQTIFIEQGRQPWNSPVHSDFADLPQSFMHNCEATQSPEALATPDPLLDEPDASARIEVSFIVGTDGRVHSPLILESAGYSEDRTVLNAVRSWRFRPAMCNGVPTEAEAKVEFSSH